MDFKTATSLVLGLALSMTVPRAAVAGLVGSYLVNDGPDYADDPPTYSCVEACALVFGGSADDYQCSTRPDSIDNQAFVSGWDDEQFCTTPTSETFKINDFYDCGVTACSYSAYVSDHCNEGETNYCFSDTAPAAAAAPAMSVPLLAALALSLLAFGVTRRKRRSQGL